MWNFFDTAAVRSGRAWRALPERVARVAFLAGRSGLFAAMADRLGRQRARNVAAPLDGPAG